MSALHFFSCFMKNFVVFREEVGHDVPIESAHSTFDADNLGRLDIFLVVFVAIKVVDTLR